MAPILQLLLFVSIMIVIAKVAGHLSAKIGQPPVFGKILAGLILGPSLLNMFGWPVFQPSPSAETASLLPEIIHYLAEIGVILLMFIAGLETDVKGVLKVGNNAFWAAAGGVVLPMGIGTWFSRSMGFSMNESLFIGTILTATSVSITAQTLMELGALKSKEGSTILGAAVIDDVMGIIVLSLVVAFSLNPASGGSQQSGILSIGLLLVQIALFFVISVLVGVKFFEPVLKYSEKLSSSKAMFAFVLVICFLYAWAAEYFGKVAAITGSYMAGVLFTRTSFYKKIEDAAKTFAYPFFVPIFLLDIGLKANARELGSNITFTVVIIVIAVLAKVIGCFAGSLATGFNMKESARVGIGMISRGEVGLIIASYGLTHAIIERDIFSAMVLMVLVTTLITPVLLRFVFPKKQVIET